MTLLDDVPGTEVVSAPHTLSLFEAMRLMRQHKVHSLLVYDMNDSPRIPIGIVSDRDIMIESVVKEMDVTEVRLADIVTNGVLTVTVKEGILETLSKMRICGTGRVLVTNNDNKPLYIASMEELFERVLKELCVLVNAFYEKRFGNAAGITSIKSI